MQPHHITTEYSVASARLTASEHQHPTLSKPYPGNELGVDSSPESFGQGCGALTACMHAYVETTNT